MVKLGFALVCLVSFSIVFAGEVAVATMVRGEVTVTFQGKTVKLLKDQSVEEGSTVKTAEKSFVKLVFTDKSQMNIGPKSEMKIEKFSGKDSGVIDLVKGQIRSQVSKDYLQMDKDKSKMFIKTSNAVMGIRGTDFMISTNGVSTSTVLFEGQVVFNNLDPSMSGDNISTNRLEAIVNEGVKIMPGEFSVATINTPEPTQPAILNVEQKENLEKNLNFDTTRSPSNTEGEAKKSIVPEGLTGLVVSNTSETLKTEVATTVGVPVSQQLNPITGATNPNGFVDGNTVKPANGSFLHLESGVIIPPPTGSVFDKNTNTYIPSPGNGKIAADGSYLPPKNVEITTDGKLLISTVDSSGVKVVQEVNKPAPLITTNAVTLTSATQILTMNPPPIGTSPNDILNKQFLPGGFTDVNNILKNNTTGITPTDILINNTSANHGKLNITIGP